MPEGGQARFRLTESPVMAPALQAQYPEIRCYTGVGIDDPTATLKCDLTPKGFHAMIRSARRDAVFIDPYQPGDREHYLVYNKSDFRSKKEPFVCGVPDMPDLPGPAKTNAPELAGDCLFRQYRLALACTGEYAQFQGGTVQLALAAMNTTINRVNGVYERDLAITLQLIANDNLLVFLNAATDGYSNGNTSSMLTENQSKCNTIIGSLNYDIGHVFGTSGGGLSGQGVVCGNSIKAWGVTAVSQPVGDPFDIDYVAHEMGHQLGASHTFNNSCNDNINLGTAFEPGSGSTIMAYAGICAPNVQTHSDAYFHGISLQEIGAYVTTAAGNVCPVKINIGNHAPTVDAGANRTIPKSTPFSLTAAAADADGDALTYCWEQMDNEQSPMPPVSTSAGGPLFRSLAPDGSPTRYFPRLPDLISNTGYAWEKLPGVARAMNFRVTVRDNHPGGGCTADDNLVLTVAANAGPFVVTAPNTAVTWYVGDMQTVSWNVANTDIAPVNCAMVRISLSTDGGLTYPTVLADNVPNNGSAQVEVPNQLSAACRVRVAAVGNIFFDISNQDFKIELPPAPTFLFNISAMDQEQACTGGTLGFTEYTTSVSGFADTIHLSLSGAPAGAIVQINPAILLPGDSATVALTNLTTPGVYTLNLQAMSGVIVRTRTIQLTLVDGAPPAPDLTLPADGAVNVVPATTLQWAPVAGALTYQVQVATNPSFAPGALVSTQTVAAPVANLSGLSLSTVYYWRVKAANACAQSPYSVRFAFQTGQPDCGHTYTSTNVPVVIPSTDASIVTSTLSVPDDRFITDVNLSVQIDHTWVGDLIARVIAPSNVSATLFDQPGYPLLDTGCNGANLDLDFDDEATQTAAQLESTCGNMPAISGTFQPVQALDRFDQSSAQGIWTLEVTDNLPEDGGAINAWGLEFCFLDTVPAADLLVNNPLTVLAGGSANLTLSHLVLNIFSGNATDGLFVLLSTPQHGTLALNGVPLAVGGIFTQQDILDAAVAYTHNGDAATADHFEFDVLDQSAGAWLHGLSFDINIIQNDLDIAAEVTEPLLCHDDAIAQITATATGGAPPLSYSLNGGAPQVSGVFDNLSAGTYTVVVTDQNGFTAESDPVVVDNPLAIEVVADVVTDDITAVATGGAPPLEYSLNGTDFQSSNFFENLANGAYTVTVRDANGCTGAAGAVVEVDQLEALVSLTTPISCHGDATGVITVNAAGGVMPYLYSLNGIDFQNGKVFSGLSAGMYTVVVKDDSGNTATSNTVSLTDPPALVVSAVADLNTITVTASGGTGTLMYSLNGTNFQTSKIFVDLANGVYTVTVRDSRGCTATTTATVDVPPLVIVAVNVDSAIACAGGATALAVSAAGGVPPYAYSLDGGPFQPDSLFENVSAGMHSIRVRDDALTIVENTAVEVTEPDPISATVSVTGKQAQVNAAGGTPPYLYALDGGDSQSSDTFSNLANGMHQVTVTDANGCTGIFAFQVDYTPLDLFVASTDPLCASEATGSIILGISGGTPPYDCSINNSGTCTVTNLPAGAYSIVIVDALGDTAQTTVTLTDPPALQANVLVFSDSIVISASGGSGALAYSLDGVSYQSSPVFEHLPNGTYAVRVRDANGCLLVVENIVIDFVATVEPGLAWGLSVQPNPSTGRFRLTLLQAPAGTLHAGVFDIAGRLVWDQTFEPGGGLFSTAIDLRTVPPGVYLLRLASGTQAGVVRLVVQ